ncbi:hypothetical protein AVEN_11071-1 [Araneus ventricosus]|uniref:Uncharacterized protein n=1 Tax=Araneus ventricosus TaxID=182803 RepID=A0A4Y2QCT8_ARAVE|nr:hypothetical protein AVEN_11071-1 [Araneus ventricosus]
MENALTSLQSDIDVKGVANYRTHRLLPPIQISEPRALPPSIWSTNHSGLTSSLFRNRPYLNHCLYIYINPSPRSRRKEFQNSELNLQG